MKGWTDEVFFDCSVDSVETLLTLLFTLIANVTSYLYGDWRRRFHASVPFIPATLSLSIAVTSDHSVTHIWMWIRLDRLTGYY